MILYLTVTLLTVCVCQQDGKAAQVSAACAICPLRLCTGLLRTMLSSSFSRYLNETLRLIKCATCRDHWMPDCGGWEKAPKSGFVMVEVYFRYKNGAHLILD